MRYAEAKGANSIAEQTCSLSYNDIYCLPLSCASSCSFCRNLFPTFFNNYDKALWCAMSDDDDDTWNMFITTEHLMHASDLRRGPHHSGECRERAQINNKILAYNEISGEFMALWQMERWRPKDDGMCNFCVLPIIRFAQQPKLIWICFNITIAIKRSFSMETGLRSHEDDRLQVLVPHFCVLLNFSPILLGPAYINVQMVFNLTLHAVDASRQLYEETREAAKTWFCFVKRLERCKI